MWYLLLFSLFSNSLAILEVLPRGDSLEAYISNQWPPLTLFEISSAPDLISDKCLADIQKWKTSFSELAAELIACTKLPNAKGCQVFKKQMYTDNIYAIYQVDSFGKIPSNLLNFHKIWMGDYDECLNVYNPTDETYKTQFCWAHMNVPVGKLKGETDLQSTCGKEKSTDVKLSICMPRTCSEDDILYFINSFGHPFGMNTSNACEISCRPTEHKPDPVFWLMTAILIIVILLAVFATIADYYAEEMGLDGYQMKNGSAMRYFLAFSALSNGRSLLSISKNRNVLKGVECVRFFSFTWVVGGHIWGMFCYADNPLDVLHIFKVQEYEVWINAFFSVDTFFFLSGLMVSYSFLPKLNIQKAMSPMTWLMFFVHRILRLTPAYMFFILFYTTYGQLLDIGPNEIVRKSDMENCRSYGWKNLLYVNNIIEPRISCFSISWYLATDTQIYLAAPLFLIAFTIGPLIGIIVSIIAISTSVALNYYLFYKYDLPTTLLQAFKSADPLMVHHTQDLLYAASYIRIPPFIFGIFLGYVLWKTRDRKISINIGVNLFMWIISTILALGAIFAAHSSNSGEPWTIFERSTYYAFSRLAWSFSLCWLMFAINRGHGGLITKFMSLNFWTPLGKLSFCAYLCHIMIAGALFNIDRNAPHFVGATHVFVSKIVPTVFLSMIFALFWSLLFEMPFAKLEGFLLRGLMGPRAKKSEKESECTKI